MRRSPSVSIICGSKYSKFRGTSWKPVSPLSVLTPLNKKTFFFYSTRWELTIKDNLFTSVCTSDTILASGPNSERQGASLVLVLVSILTINSSLYLEYIYLTGEVEDSRALMTHNAVLFLEMH